MVRSIYKVYSFATKILMLAQAKLPIVAQAPAFTRPQPLIPFRLEVPFNGIYVPVLFSQREKLVGRKER